MIPYERLIQINRLDLHDKRVAIVGAGWMGAQYAKALSAMGIRDVDVIARTEESARRCAGNYGYRPRWHGCEDVLPRLEPFDLVIVASSIPALKPAVDVAISCGNRNILVEKPATLHSTSAAEWADQVADGGARVRVAFNRHMYPSLWKLKALAAAEGGIESCSYTFTEWVHTINFGNNSPEVYERWGISNSLHVIAMAHDLIGLPTEFAALRAGGFPWHRAGSRFAGAGTTERGVLFSYHANWGSAGRWGLEVNTAGNAYRLIPLEKLLTCARGTVTWEPVDLAAAYPDVKEGVAEEIAVMLDAPLEADFPLADLSRTASVIGVAEKIFGYCDRPEREQ